jgi:hypothetical protein
MTVLWDAAGWRRSPATMPGYHARRQSGNQGMQAATLSDRITGGSAPALPPGPPRSKRPHPDLRDSRVSSNGSVSQGSPRPPESAGLSGEQQSRRALPLLVRRGRLLSVGGDARISR